MPCPHCNGDALVRRLDPLTLAYHCPHCVREGTVTERQKEPRDPLLCVWNDRLHDVDYC